MVGVSRGFKGDGRASCSSEWQQHLDLSARACLTDAFRGSCLRFAPSEGALFVQQTLRSCLVMRCQVGPAFQLWGRRNGSINARDVEHGLASASGAAQTKFITFKLDVARWATCAAGILSLEGDAPGADP